MILPLLQCWGEQKHMWSCRPGICCLSQSTRARPSCTELPSGMVAKSCHSTCHTWVCKGRPKQKLSKAQVLFCITRYLHGNQQQCEHHPLTADSNRYLQAEQYAFKGKFSKTVWVIRVLQASPTLTVDLIVLSDCICIALLLTFTNECSGVTAVMLQICSADLQCRSAMQMCIAYLQQLQLYEFHRKTLQTLQLH